MILAKWKVIYKHNGNDSIFECNTEKVFNTLMRRLFNVDMPKHKNSTVIVERLV